MSGVRGRASLFGDPGSGHVVDDELSRCSPSDRHHQPPRLLTRKPLIALVLCHDWRDLDAVILPPAG